MTCQEFRKLVSAHPPAESTTAEVNAVYRHQQACAACHGWLERQAEREEAGLDDPAATSADKAVIERALDDPECTWN